MIPIEKQSDNRSAFVNKVAIGCAVVIVIFFMAVHSIVNYFLIPIMEKAFGFWL
jgi:antibiotic biosynthesis monooxygenase (ABM) superfamily enzyme